MTDKHDCKMVHDFVACSEEYFNGIYLSYLKKDYNKSLELLKELRKIMENVDNHELKEMADNLIEAFLEDDIHYVDENIKKFLSVYREMCHKIR